MCIDSYVYTCAERERGFIRALHFGHLQTVCVCVCVCVCVYSYYVYICIKRETERNYEGQELCTLMGWLRLVGFLKSEVFFAKEPCKRDDILQRRPMILRSLVIIATL